MYIRPLSVVFLKLMFWFIYLANTATEELFFCTWWDLMLGDDIISHPRVSGGFFLHLSSPDLSPLIPVLTLDWTHRAGCAIKLQFTLTASDQIPNTRISIKNQYETAIILHYSFLNLYYMKTVSMNVAYKHVYGLEIKNVINSIMLLNFPPC